MDLKAEWALFRRALPMAKTIVLSSGRATGIEVSGELGENLNGQPGWFGGISASKTSITVYTARSQILSELRPSIATNAEALLLILGTTVIRNTRL
ncbi:hypothetical protein WAI453_008727 [Rhynchosporium graminicola]|uniref:Uncharacterized protein n=1 Tax=Rhynchosporium graminicola TaxID=2792576 RepID=A0A1E1KHW6_9HELO|nr:uncharacterized protein RCO7_00147 [Rhynchosporium commune]